MAQQFNNFDLLRMSENQGAQANGASKKKKNKSKNKAKQEQQLNNNNQENQTGSTVSGQKQNVAQQQKKLIKVVEKEVSQAKDQQSVNNLIKQYSQQVQNSQGGVYQDLYYQDFKQVLLESNALEQLSSDILSKSQATIQSLLSLLTQVFPPKNTQFIYQLFSTIQQFAADQSKSVENSKLESINGVVVQTIQDLRNASVKGESDVDNESVQNEMKQNESQQQELLAQIEKINKTNKDKTTLMRLYEKLSKLSLENFEVQKNVVSGDQSYSPSLQTIQLLRGLKESLQEELQTSQKAQQNGAYNQSTNSEAALLEQQASQVQEQIKALEEQIIKLRVKKESLLQSKQQLLQKTEKQSKGRKQNQEFKVEDNSQLKEQQYDFVSSLESLLSKSYLNKEMNAGSQNVSKYTPLTDNLLQYTRLFIENCQQQHYEMYKDLESKTKRLEEQQTLFELAQQFDGENKHTFVQQALSSTQDLKKSIQNSFGEIDEVVGSAEKMLLKFVEQSFALKLNPKFFSFTQPIVEATINISKDHANLIKLLNAPKYNLQINTDTNKFKQFNNRVQDLNLMLMQ